MHGPRIETTKLPNPVAWRSGSTYDLMHGPGKPLPSEISVHNGERDFWCVFLDQTSSRRETAASGGKENWIFAVVEHWAWKSEVFVEGTGFRGKETADRNPSFVGRV